MTSDLRALVASRGSLRRVAAALGMPESTLRGYVDGLRTVPDGLEAALRRLKPVGSGRAGNPRWMARRAEIAEGLKNGGQGT